MTRRSPPAPCWIGQARWEPPLAGPGFYRVRASLVGVPTTAGRDQSSLAIVTSWPAPAQSEFGWTLPRTRQPLTQPRLVELLSQAGIRWVKYPLWCDTSANVASLDRAVAFRDALDARGIELIGLLLANEKQLGIDKETTGGLSQFSSDEDGTGYPPAQFGRAAVMPLPIVGGRLARRDERADDWGVPTRFRRLGARHFSAVQTFAPPVKVWYPSLEPTMIRLATQVRWWQLGTDGDTSFVGRTGLAAKIAEVKAALDRMGQGVHVGMGWDLRGRCPPPRSRRGGSSRFRPSRRSGRKNWPPGSTPRDPPGWTAGSCSRRCRNGVTRRRPAWKTWSDA